jgi:hypothetical protein
VGGRAGGGAAHRRAVLRRIGIYDAGDTAGLFALLLGKANEHLHAQARAQKHTHDAVEKK